MESDPPEVTVQAILSLAGTAVRFRGRLHWVIEVLVDEPALVLSPVEDAREIQADAYGHARRQAPALVTVPVFAGPAGELHPDFLALDLRADTAPDPTLDKS